MVSLRCMFARDARKMSLEDGTSEPVTLRIPDSSDATVTVIWGSSDPENTNAIGIGVQAHDADATCWISIVDMPTFVAQSKLVRMGTIYDIAQAIPDDDVGFNLILREKSTQAKAHRRLR